MLLKPALTLLASALLLAAVGCKSGYNKKMEWKDPEETGENARTCAETPKTAHSGAVDVYKRLRKLSCTQANPDGVLMGQSMGSYYASSVDPDTSYQRLFIDLETATDSIPAVLSVDLEYDLIYNDQQLERLVTDTLAPHQAAGGLISISWSPMNPWISGNSPGFGNPDERRWSEEVDLASLWDPESDMHAIWISRLELISYALTQLQNAGIPVLWSPFPEMNDEGVWWGFEAFYNEADRTDVATFKEFWEKLHTYLTVDKQLTNLLWVYSPAKGESWPTGETAPTGAPADWAYPGADYVDIVAPVVRSKDLTFSDNSALKALNKPMGLALFSPLPDNDEDAPTVTEEKPFDATTYLTKLKSYPAIAYWVASHPVTVAGIRSPVALVDMNKVKELTDDAYILDRDDVKDINVK